MTGDAIYAILYNSGSGPVYDLIGNKIWPDQAAQNSSYPYVIYRIDETRPNDTKDGASTVDEVTVIVEAYATSRTSARSIAEAVRTALDRKTAGTYGGIDLDGVQFRDQRTATFATDPHVYIFEQEYKLRYKR